MTPTAVIAGAGIGGLSAGIALRRAGWDIRILERAPSPRELGFALLMAPNAIAALRELGVAEAVLEHGHEPTRGELRRLDGSVVKRVEMRTREALGGPLVVTLRSALHEALLAAVGTEALRLSSEVVGYAESDEGVRVSLATGEVIEGHLLVGADGLQWEFVAHSIRMKDLRAVAASWLFGVRCTERRRA